MDGTTDYRLTNEQLKEAHLPQEVDAFPWYPQGIEIPVGKSADDAFYIDITEPWEAPPEHSDPSEYCTLGVYAYDGRNDCSMIDLRLDELESAVITLLATIRHDTRWLENACAIIHQWFEEGKG